MLAEHDSAHAGSQAPARSARGGQNREIIIWFPSALPLTRPGMREEILHRLFLQGRVVAGTIGEFKTVNKEVMGSEPAAISSLAAAITWDISR